MNERALADPPVPAGEVYDEVDKLIGRYVYLKPEDQGLLDQFCQSWLDTYDQDNKFFITLDLETTGLKPHEGQILLVSISWDGKQSIIFSPHGFDLELFFQVLETIPINNQNIKFDLKWILYHWKVECRVFLDTMVASQLGWAGAFPENSFGLGNLAKQLLSGFVLEKETRMEFVGMKLEDGFTKRQIEYAVKDSLITHRLVYPIMKRLDNQGLWDIWEEIERPLIEVLVRSEIKGTKVDIAEVEKLLNQKEKELNDISNEIKAQVELIPEDKRPKFPKVKGSEGFNPGSSQQIVNVLAAKGIKVLNTRKETLQSANATSPDLLLERIIKWRSTKSVISKFLTKWLEVHIDPKTSCIYTSFNTYGAETGRLSCKEPNMQQIPGDLRSMIIARDGYNILSMDYSQFEFRGAAGITQEEYLIEAFVDRARLLVPLKELCKKYNYIDPDSFVKDVAKEKVKVSTDEAALIHEFALTDIHRRNAAIILGKDVSEITAKERSVGKCVSLDTYVHTYKGIMKVGELLPKRKKADTFYDLKDVKILTDEGFRDCPQIYYNGKSKAIKIVTDYGRSITCSPHHRFRTTNNKGKYVWVTADLLRPGMDLFVKTDKPMFGDQKGKLPFGMKTQDENVKFGTLVGIYLRHGSVQEDMVVFPGELYEKVSNLVKEIPEFAKLKISTPTKKDGMVFVKAPSLAQWFADNISSDPKKKKIPASMLVTGKQWVLECLVKELASKSAIGYVFPSESPELLRQINNLLTRWCCPGHMVSANNTVFGLPTLVVQGGNQGALRKRFDDGMHIGCPYEGIESWYIHSSEAVYTKLFTAVLDEGIPQGTEDQIEEWVKVRLTPTEFETTKFLKENHLRRDKVAYKTEVADIEMCDVVVPDNHTVVYEGLVTHNTLGYAVLYGAGASQIQESLAKEDFYHTIPECNKFLEDFFERLPKIKRFIEETHAQVLIPGYISTVMGRKRYFDLPPKYQTRRYEQEKQAAFREATNFCFQGANADATKKAMVQMDNVFRKYPESVRPILLLTVHDEVVIEVHKSNAEEVAKIGEKIMVEAGLESLNWKAPVEVSRTMGPTWMK